MSSLKYHEKRQLEELFGMKTGYLLDFTNRTFEEFMQDVADVDIYAPQYEYESGSKANRLRAFWTDESDETVVPVLDALVDLASMNADLKKVEAARRIVNRLRGATAPNPGNSKPNQESGLITPPQQYLNEGVYDVALSFAGEQRPYVSQVANALRSAGIKVFYDEFEDLWGKDLVVGLEKVYRSGSRYVVVFVSREYVSKAWTNHERQHALAGRIERQDDSVLPVHFDDTQLPGLPSSVGYLDICSMQPEDLATRIQRKLEAGG